jgi:HopA1 effector protein family
MRLDEFLQNLLRDLQIDPDLNIQLAGYEELLAPEPVVERLRLSDRSLQSKFLADQLQDYLLDVFFRQVQQPLAAQAAEVEPEKPVKVFANDSAGSLDSEFYTNLAVANSGRGYYDPDWEVEGFAPDGWVLVLKDNLHLQTPPTHIHPAPSELAVGDLAAIVMPKNLLTVDRYIAISNRGRLRDLPIVSCYFNCPAAAVIELVSGLCGVLNQAELVFELEVELDETNYQRSESVILRLARDSFGQVEPLLREVYRTMGGKLRSATPLFTKAVAPGVGIAEIDSLTLDFGQRLWGAVARGCGEFWRLELIDLSAQLEVVRSELSAVSIDINHPYLLAHTDIYSSWE